MKKEMAENCIGNSLVIAGKESNNECKFQVISTFSALLIFFVVSTGQFSRIYRKMQFDNERHYFGWNCKKLISLDFTAISIGRYYAEKTAEKIR